MTMFKVKSKVWVEFNEKHVMGEGKYRILEEVNRWGSINKAAKNLGISYRKAWSWINSMESRLNLKLVDRQKGGRNGGKAVLTKEAEELMVKYKELVMGLNEFIDKRFREPFK
jgi:molybdate transport system regulatory protein